MASAPQVSVRRREARDMCSNACSNAADFAVVRECSPMSESLALLGIRSLANSGERAAEVWGLEGHRSPKCPAAVGCRRVSVGNAHVSCRWKGRFRWSRACRRWSVNPSRKLRRFESFTCHHVRERAFDQRKRGRRPSFLYLVGVSKTTVFWRSAGCWIAGL